jgi:AbiV family abortive infection protein
MLSDAILRLARGMGADKNTPIVANAARLLRDAKLLNEHGRHASAFALAALSLEEIGKVILRLWDVQQRKGYDHLSKQRAVASLLLAQFVVCVF